MFLFYSILFYSILCDHLEYISTSGGNQIHINQIHINKVDMLRLRHVLYSYIVHVNVWRVLPVLLE